ncbi:MAG: hypothetical protein Q8906_00195 [Bacillota bacterium]|nr:hypothetical protein [Bacillota bacterium]MDP4168991.1 hypothetical protein [Bacillota bacterium]
MKIFIKGSVLLAITIFVLNACGNSSFKEEVKLTKSSVQSAFDEKDKERNQTINKVNFYLPFGYEIKEKTANNMILKNGSKTYILFYNPLENSKSEVVYKASINQHKNLDVNKTFKKGNKLGFLLIERLKNDMCEVTVGVGGAKLTTETRSSNMASEAKEMMEMAKSVKAKK